MKVDLENSSIEELGRKNWSGFPQLTIWGGTKVGAFAKKQPSYGGRNEKEVA